MSTHIICFCVFFDVVFFDTITTLNTGTDRPHVQTAKTQIRHCRMWHLIWVYSSSTILDTSTGSKIDVFKY